ncbi:hypothetical protein SELMODRAFT_431399 [Selaginella moellendorffii]|uniref:Uncharacterized protein n=1 Tax=Selaginella moellendorffii TaxID=88036 RepID=D8TCH3_SELML|nr:uncharacterized protein LOC9640843 [Selaginella moellendorffii]EFJ05637.1 hypothetical protein SELMODRAFT_431399 [Selaginella moellendorffii]|eukprot:XP_002993312.1 uncharacterized protein LOC9640843 [Selaginella moellendorffii]
MWLWVVAAGSGYLARCLQNASSSNQSKRLRLSDDENISRSPPDQVDCLLSEEALRVKDRFERLGEEEKSVTQEHGAGGSQSVDDKRWKRSCCGNSPRDVLEASLVTSFQKGIHESRLKSKNKTKGWPSWPRAQSRCQEKCLSSDDFEGTTVEINEAQARNGFSLEGNSGSGANGGDISTVDMDVTVRTSLGDVSWTTSKQDVENLCLDDLPNILDWTTMAAAQKHNMFGPMDGSLATSRMKKIYDRKSRGRSKSRDSSVPATPNIHTVPASLAMLPTARKRKALNGSSNIYESSAKEVLLFAMGVHAAMTFMVLYKKREMELPQQPTDTQNTKFGIEIPDDCHDDDDESMTSVVTVETKTDPMAVLEAELAAELEIMQLNLSTGKANGAEREPSNVSSSSSSVSLQDDFIEIFDDGSSPPQNQHWAISPRELDRRLHIVLEERQAKQIKELEAELKEAEKKLHMKDVEIRSWKDRVYRMSESSLISPTDVDESPTARPASSRRRWFAEELGGPPLEDSSSRSGRIVHSLPSLVSAMSSCHINDEDDEADPLERKRNMRSSFMMDRPTYRSSVTVSDITGRLNEKNGRTGAFDPFYAGKFSASGNGVLLPADAEARQTDTQIHEKLVQWNSTKLPYDYQQSQVIRTVETIEERRYQRTRCQASLEREEKWLAKRGKSRHSTGNLISSRYRSQRPRRRWFS